MVCGEDRVSHAVCGEVRMSYAVCEGHGHGKRVIWWHEMGLKLAQNLVGYLILKVRHDSLRVFTRVAVLD
jgi:hypothetical protein